MEIQDVGHSCRKSWMAEEFDLLGLFVLYEVHISHSNDCPPPPHTPFRCLLRFRRGVATLVLGVADKPLTFEPDKWTNLQPPFPASLPSPTTLHLLHLELPSQPLHQEHKNQTDWKEKCLNLNVKTIYYHFSIRLERSASWLIHIHSNTVLQSEVGVRGCLIPNLVFTAQVSFISHLSFPFCFVSASIPSTWD